jgi:hypothetical protein
MLYAREGRDDELKGAAQVLFGPEDVRQPGMRARERWVEGQRLGNARREKGRVGYLERCEAQYFSTSSSGAMLQDTKTERTERQPPASSSQSRTTRPPTSSARPCQPQLKRGTRKAPTPRTKPASTAAQRATVVEPAEELRQAASFQAWRRTKSERASRRWSVGCRSHAGTTGACGGALLAAGRPGATAMGRVAGKRGGVTRGRLPGGDG